MFWTAYRRTPGSNWRTHTYFKFPHCEFVDCWMRACSKPITGDPVRCCCSNIVATWRGVARFHFSMFITQTSRAYQIRFCGHRMVIVGHTYDDVEVAIQLWLLLTFSNTLCFAWLAIMLFEIHLVSNLARQLIVKGILCNSDHVYPLIKVLLPLATLAHRANHSAMLLL